MKTRFATLFATMFAAATIGGLSACAKQERVREIDWAKAALARNPAFEIIATDDSAGVFTVRDTSSGTVRTLRLEDLIAAPLPPKAATSAAAGTAAQPALAATAPPIDAAAAAPVTRSEPAVETPAQSLADVQTTETGVRTNDQSVAEGPGYRISRGAGGPAANASATLEGPGYRITRDEPNKEVAKTNAESVASNVEKRTDPIICQGDRLMRIDGETIEFTGDALIVEKGCDLYISNTNIRAGGVGIIARQARVHIVNSSIGGTRGSYEASEGAEIYVARSTFTGVGRRFDSATMNDLGGNAYQTH
jgi:hypothetical protein